MPFLAVLALPILFAAGMSLLDTIDGSFMNFAYGWAFSKPVRKVYYNITITGLSVAVAVIIGTVELLSVLQSELNLHGGVWDFAANFISCPLDLFQGIRLAQLHDRIPYGCPMIMHGPKPNVNGESAATLTIARSNSA